MRTEQELLAKIASLESDIDAEKMYSRQSGEAVEQIAAERDELSAKIKALESEKESLMEDLKISELGNEVKANKLAELAAQSPIGYTFPDSTPVYAAAGAAPIQSSSFPEHDPNLPNNEQGIFRKFLVSRVDGSDKPGGKHHGCEYFVLDMMHDKHAPAALRAYAESCKTTHPKLSTDLVSRFVSAPTETLSQFDIRGQLAARLSCWHRLTESESKELVKLFEVGEKHVATVGCTECKFVNIAPGDAPCCNCNRLEFGIDNFVRKDAAP